MSDPFPIAGKFWTCNDHTVANVTECVGTFNTHIGEPVAREWRNAPLNFDHIGNALLTLVEVGNMPNACLMLPADSIHGSVPVHDLGHDAGCPWTSLVASPPMA